MPPPPAGRNPSAHESTVGVPSLCQRRCARTRAAAEDGAGGSALGAPAAARLNGEARHKDMPHARRDRDACQHQHRTGAHEC